MKVILRPQRSLLMSPSIVFSSPNSTSGDQIIQPVNLSALNNFINNSSNDSSQSQGIEFDAKTLFKILGSVALASLIGVGIWKANKKTTENIGSSSASSPATISRNSSSNDTFPIPNTLEERIALAKQVCEDGNNGMHCQTMAPLNALRILQAWGDPRGASFNLETIRNRLENTEKEAFSRSNWLNDGQMHTGSIIKNIVPQIIFDELEIPFGEYRVVSSEIFSDKPSLTQNYKIHHESLLRLLEELHKGKVGTFSYVYPYSGPLIEGSETNYFGGHTITVYGFERGSSYEELKTLIAIKDSLDENDFQSQFDQLLPNIGKLYCYEQDNRSERLEHHQLNISDLLNPNGNYRIAEFTIIDGDPKERDVTLHVLADAYSAGEFAAILRPEAKQKFQSLETEEGKMKYFLSRAYDLGVPESDLLARADYISAT